jgi:Domain of Unknown Function (DUF1080)
MNRRLFTIAAGLALAMAPGAIAAEEGFKPLFNGKDLTGWVTPENKDLFSVENGEIVGRSKAGELKKNEFLVTDKTYGDFVLKAKVKLKNHNSGIQFRSDRAANGAVGGPQADVADGYWGSLYEEKRRSKLLVQYPKEKADVLVHKGDWNEFEITAKGDHVIIKLNGTQVVDLVDPKFDKTGIIALQLHAGPAMEVRFKDIEIKPLSD